MNLLTLFGRARAGLNLTPSERALLKLIKSLLGAGFLSLLVAVPTVMSYAQGNQVFTVAGVSIMAGAFVRGFMEAWEKYVSAHGDQPLAQVLGQFESAVLNALPLHQQAAPSPTPAPVVPVVASDPSARSASAI